MAESTQTNRDDKASEGNRKPRAERPDEQKSGRQAPTRKLDIVEEAGKGSFPASDPPPWTP